MMEPAMAVEHSTSSKPTHSELRWGPRGRVQCRITTLARPLRAERQQYIQRRRWRQMTQASGDSGVPGHRIKVVLVWQSCRHRSVCVGRGGAVRCIGLMISACCHEPRPGANESVTTSQWTVVAGTECNTRLGTKSDKFMSRMQGIARRREAG